LYLPDGVPGWAGWFLFALTCIFWLLEYRSRNKTAVSAAHKHDAETRKINIETLGVISDQLERDLRAGLVALQAHENSLSTESQEKIIAHVPKMGNYVRANAAVRSRAMTELPDLLLRLAALQRQQAAALSALQVSMVPNNELIARMGKELADLVEQTASLLKAFASGPSFHVGPTPPTHHNNIAVWIDTSGEATRGTEGDA